MCSPLLYRSRPLVGFEFNANLYGFVLTVINMQKEYLSYGSAWGYGISEPHCRSMRSVIPHSSSGTRYGIPEKRLLSYQLLEWGWHLIGTTTVITSCSLSESVLTGISESFKFASESGDVLIALRYILVWSGDMNVSFSRGDEVLGVSVGVWLISVGREDSGESLKISRCPSFYVTTRVFPTVRADLEICNCESSSK